MNPRSQLLRNTVVATLLVATTPSFAQNASAPAADNGRTIESIIVTAQKREQSLQDVPIVVTAVSEQLLQDSGVKDIKDLTLLTPGLIVTSTSNETQTTARIRGIGTVGDNPGLESSVGVVIDGVYRPRNGVGFGDLGELERVEVLKGPQGTLFGKNTTAGVINIVSKKPTFDFGATAEVTAGNYGALEGSGSINVPVSEMFAARLYGAVRERDGTIDVVTGAGPRTQDEDFDRSFKTARAQFLLKLSDALDIRLVGDYTKRDENCCAAPQMVLTPTAGVLTVLNLLAPGASLSNPADPYERVAYLNRSTTQELEEKGASAEINWDLDALGGATVTSVSAWRDWEAINGQDADFTTVDILYRNANGGFANEFKQLSQELRIAGETDQLSWLFGAFYADEDLESHNQLYYGNQFQTYFSLLLQNPAAIAGLTGLGNAAYVGGQSQRDVYEQDGKTWALFTNNSFRFTDALELTLGARFTDESKDLDTQYFNEHGGVGCQALRNRLAIVAGTVGAANLPTVYGIGCATYADPVFNNLFTRQSLDESEWTGTVKLSYRFTDQLMTYLSAARGYKASGFNLDRERTNNNITNNPLYPGDPDPTRPGQFLPGTAGVIRADSDTHFNKETVDSYEVGAKSQWLADSLSLNAAIFYQDYTDFQLNTFTGISFVVTSLPQVVSQGVDLDVVWYTPLEQLSLQGGVTYAETTIEDFGTAIAFFRAERKDDILSFAPKWSGSLSATFEQPFGASMVFRTNVGAKYTSEYNTGSNLDRRKIQGAYTLVNARIGLGRDDEAWMVEAWAQNLTDKEYVQVAFDATLQGSSAGAVPTSTIDGFLGAPRTYGVTARFKF